VSGRLHKAADWHKIREELVNDYARVTNVNGRQFYLGLDPDANKIVTNMDKMVDNISRLEIVARTGKRRKYDEAIVEFNEHLELMEQFFLMNKLMNG
jgi:hypothetical protein